MSDKVGHRTDMVDGAALRSEPDDQPEAVRDLRRALADVVSRRFPSLRKLATAADISPDTASRAVNGPGVPTPATIDKILIACRRPDLDDGRYGNSWGALHLAASNSVKNLSARNKNRSRRPTSIQSVDAANLGGKPVQVKYTSRSDTAESLAQHLSQEAAEPSVFNGPTDLEIRKMREALLDAQAAVLSAEVSSTEWSLHKIHNLYVPRRARLVGARAVAHSLIPTVSESLELTSESIASERQNMILLGSPGLGKTTFFLHLAGDLAHRHVGPAGQEPTAPHIYEIPLFVRAAILADEQHNAWHDALARAASHELGQRLSRQIDGRVFDSDEVRWLILIDGLDEVVDPARRRQLIESIRVHVTRRPDIFRFLLSARSLAQSEFNELEDGGFIGCELQPFNDLDLRQLALNRFPVVDGSSRSTADKYLQALSDANLTDMAENPLLAMIAAEVHEDAPETSLPGTVFLLYEEFISRLLSRRKSSDLTFSGETLRALAENLAEKSLQVEVDLIDQAGKFLEIKSRPAIRDLLNNMGLFAISSAGINFIHRTFVEHLAGHAIAAVASQQMGLRSAIVQNWIKSAKNSPEWKLQIGDGSLFPGQYELDGSTAFAAILASVRRSRQWGQKLLEYLLNSNWDDQMLAGKLMSAGFPCETAEVDRFLDAFTFSAAHCFDERNPILGFRYRDASAPFLIVSRLPAPRTAILESLRRVAFNQFACVHERDEAAEWFAKLSSTQTNIVERVLVELLRRPESRKEHVADLGARLVAIDPSYESYVQKAIEATEDLARFADPKGQVVLTRFAQGHISWLEFCDSLVRILNGYGGPDLRQVIEVAGAERTLEFLHGVLEDRSFLCSYSGLSLVRNLREVAQLPDSKLFPNTAHYLEIIASDAASDGAVRRSAVRDLVIATGITPKIVELVFLVVGEPRGLEWSSAQDCLDLLTQIIEAEPRYTSSAVAVLRNLAARSQPYECIVIAGLLSNFGPAYRDMSLKIARSALSENERVDTGYRDIAKYLLTWFPPERFPEIWTYEVFESASLATRYDFARSALESSSIYGERFLPLRSLALQVAVQILGESSVSTKRRIALVGRALKIDLTDVRPFVSHLLNVAFSDAELSSDRTDALRILGEARILTPKQVTDALERRIEDPDSSGDDRMLAASLALNLAQDADTMGRNLVRRAIRTRDGAVLSAVVARDGIDLVRYPEIEEFDGGELVTLLSPELLASKMVGTDLARNMWLSFARPIAALIGVGKNASEYDITALYAGDNLKLMEWLRASAQFHMADVVDLLADVASDSRRRFRIRLEVMVLLVSLGELGQVRVRDLIPTVLSEGDLDNRVRFVTYLCGYGSTVSDQAGEVLRIVIADNSLSTLARIRAVVDLARLGGPCLPEAVGLAMQFGPEDKSVIDENSAALWSDLQFLRKSGQIGSGHG